jgi:mRNA interferase HigB
VTVLGIGVLHQAMKRHGDLAKPLRAWLTIAQSARWKNLAEVRKTWRDTDCVESRTIFNIKGNRYRLYSLINYETQTLIVREILTHAEYSKR